MKTQVKNLKPGDNLGNCKVVEGPIYIANYCGQKDRANIRVEFKNGEILWRVWGWLTSVTVKNR